MPIYGELSPCRASAAFSAEDDAEIMFEPHLLHEFITPRSRRRHLNYYSFSTFPRADMPLAQHYHAEITAITRPARRARAPALATPPAASVIALLPFITAKCLREATHSEAPALTPPAE